MSEKANKSAKRNFERPSESLDHFERLRESLAAWKQNIKSGGVAQDVCTLLYI